MSKADGILNRAINEFKAFIYYEIEQIDKLHNKQEKEVYSVKFSELKGKYKFYLIRGKDIPSVEIECVKCNSEKDMLMLFSTENKSYEIEELTIEDLYSLANSLEKIFLEEVKTK